MATVPLPTDTEASEALTNARVEAVFADIRRTRNSDFLNNFWRALAHQPGLLERTWASVKQTMFAPVTPETPLDPLTREVLYIAVSVTNACTYCVHSHTAAARAKGLTDAHHAELLSIIALASQTNALATALGVPVDPEFLVP